MSRQTTTDDRAEFRVDIRPLSGDDDPDALIARVQHLRRDLETELQRHLPHANLQIRRAEEIPVHDVLRLVFEIDWHAIGHAIEQATVSFAVKEALDRLKETLDISAEARRIKSAKQAGQTKRKKVGSSGKQPK